MGAKLTKGLRFFAFQEWCSILLSSCVCLPTHAYAATDGSLGSSSEGSTYVTLSIPNIVRISGISDLSFGAYGGSGSPSLDDDICIYENNTSGTYKVTAHGSGTSSAFTVTDGSNLIAYAVRFNNVTGTTSNFPLTTNVTSSTLSGANSASQTCGGGNNANFQVTLQKADLLKVPAGTYSGTLTLVIEPV